MAIFLVKKFRGKGLWYFFGSKYKPFSFNQLNLIDSLDESHFIDIRNNLELDKIIFKLRPEVVFHLAAQPLVLEGYKNPLMTWETNLMGSLNLLNSLTNLRTKLSLVMITTDKVYKNKEWIYGYREQDELGGYDPYSASKAACEMAIDSWRLSYCEPKNNEETLLRIASARSGNVIGGGDWSKDRIIPDVIRALNKNTEIILRNPNSTRPWQHVLDPLSGYILLAEKLYKYSQENNNDLKNKFATSYNFGPSIESNKKVIELVEEISKYWSGLKVTNTIDNNFHEANNLICKQISLFITYNGVQNGILRTQLKGQLNGIKKFKIVILRPGKYAFLILKNIWILKI